MSEPAESTKKSNYAFLVAPAKDLVENFSIDVLKALTGYLEAIERADNEADANPSEVFKFFDFAEGSRILDGCQKVYAKKVQHLHQLTMAVVDMLENRTESAERGGVKRGRRAANFGSTGFDLIDIGEVKRAAMAGYEKAVKDEKKEIDALRVVDNAEAAESHYERKYCLTAKPTQFMFKLDYGQIQRADEQVQNAKARPDIIGKVKDFYVKKADVIHEQEVLVSHDDYRKNLDQFTLPGARWIPDNKVLAANFGLAEIEVELDREQRKEQIDAYGPFTDPLTGREVVAPPRWFIEQEATRQHLDIQSRSTSRATAKGGGIRDSQGLGSQIASQGSQRFSQRQSQPFVERHRNNLNEFVSFVEGRINKNRPSTHLNTGLVDMFVDNFGDVSSLHNPQNGAPEHDFDYDDDFGGGASGENDENDDYVANLTQRRAPKKEVADYDVLDAVKIPMYTGEEDIPVTRKPLKVLTRIPPRPTTLLRRKQAREAKIPKSRRDEFMETHDYLQDFYYWRSAARINPDKDWKVEALRSSILTEKKRKCKERTTKIKEIRAKNLNARRSRRRNAEQFEMVDEMAEDYEQDMGGDGEAVVPNRRTMGDEYKDVVDDDLQAEVELDELGGIDYDVDFEGMDQMDRIAEDPGKDAVPMPDMDFDAPPPRDDVVPTAPEANGAAPYRPLMFEDIDDAELNNVINLPGTLFFDKALPLLKKFAEHKTDREQMAYEMAKAYEDVDVAVSTLQEQVDLWHQKMEPILDEGETRKEYDVNAVGRRVLDEYSTSGETKRLIDLCVGRPWYEISRYFLSCLFMCNMGNVMVEDDQTLSLEDRINSMRITYLHNKMQSEKMQELSFGGDAEKK